MLSYFSYLLPVIGCMHYLSHLLTVFAATFVLIFNTISGSFLTSPAIVAWPGKLGYNPSYSLCDNVAVMYSCILHAWQRNTKAGIYIFIFYSSQTDNFSYNNINLTTKHKTNKWQPSVTYHNLSRRSRHWISGPPQWRAVTKISDTGNKDARAITIYVY